MASILTVLTIAVIFSSCAVTKNVAYFENVPDTTKQKLEAEALYKDPIIMPDDILSVNLITIDPTTSSTINQAANVAISPLLGSTGSSSSLSSGTAANSIVQGLLVDKNGYIALPIIGEIKVGGLTTYEAKVLITQMAAKYFKSPDVQIRFTNFKITVLGEVLHPSVYIIPNEKVTVLDAIGLAGDLTIYGRRENVLVIREVDGKRQVTRLDLNSTDVFQSPAFYLKQNDVVYVEPNKSAIVQADSHENKIFTVALTLSTAIFLLLLRLHY